MNSPEQQRIVDELLVLDAKAGDRSAFQSLVERWQERLWRHARRVTQRDDLAGEVTQEAWLAIAQSFGKLVEPRRFGSWALSIVTRRALDRLRHVARTDALADPGRVPDSRPDEPLSSDESDAIDALRVALADLPPDQRALLALHHVEGLPLAELAAVLSVPIGTIKSRLYTARESLRAQLERTEG